MHRGCLVSLLALGVLASVATIIGCSSNPRHVTRIVLQASPRAGSSWPAAAPDRDAMLEQTRSILLKRAASLDIAGQPSVDIESGNKLVVALPELLNEPEAVRVLTDSAALEFYYLKDLYSTANPLGQWRMTAGSGTQRTLTFTGPHGEVLDSGKPADEPKILAQVVGAPTNKPVLTGADLVPNAKSALKPGTTLPVIEIEFNERGTQIFRDFTGMHVDETVAVFYDGKLLTAPAIKSKISDGKAIIEGGGMSLREATDIASHLNAGTLPVALKVVGVRK